MTMTDARPLPDFFPGLGHPSRVHLYRDASGMTLGAAYRFDREDGKTVRPYDHQTGQWTFPDPRPLYGLDYLDGNPEAHVVLVEGEKCADALLEAGFLATTVFGGCNAVGATDWEPLKDRTVIIWPDLDEPGLKYAREAAQALLNVGATSVRVIDPSPASLSSALKAPPPDMLQAAKDHTFLKGTDILKDRDVTPLLKEPLLKGWDAADALKEGWQPAHILNLFKDAPFKEAPAFAAPANDWPAPDMSILEDDMPPPAFPLDCFDPAVADYLRLVAEERSCPVDYVAGTLLTSSAALIGNSRRVSPWQSWSEPSILWCALVGSPSSGKSPAMDPVLDALSQIQADAAPDFDEACREYQEDKLAADLCRETWEQETRDAHKNGLSLPPMPPEATAPEQPARKRIKTTDATIEALVGILRHEPKGILMQRDELAGWFASFDRYSGGKGGDRAFWLECQGGRSYTQDRVKNGADPIHIPRLAVSLIGGIQPDRLRSCLLKGDDDGLAARFLYFCPDGVPRHRPCRQSDPGFILNVMRRLDALNMDVDPSGDLKPRTIPLSPEAVELFTPWWQSLPDREPTGRMAGWWGKIASPALRLALVFHYLEWAAYPTPVETPTIPAVHMEAAIRFMEDYAIPMAARAFGNAAKTETDQNMVTVAEWIRANRPERVTVRELHRASGLPGLDKAEDVRQACLKLTGANWLKMEYAGPTPKGGRPSTAFRVNPLALAA